MKREKRLCVVCNQKSIVFEIDYEGGRAEACSNCITENLLTGWSK